MYMTNISFYLHFILSVEKVHSFIKLLIQGQEAKTFFFNFRPPDYNEIYTEFQTTENFKELKKHWHSILKN